MQNMSLAFIYRPETLINNLLPLIIIKFHLNTKRSLKHGDFVNMLVYIEVTDRLRKR